MQMSPDSVFVKVQYLALKNRRWPPEQPEIQQRWQLTVI